MDKVEESLKGLSDERRLLLEQLLKKQQQEDVNKLLEPITRNPSERGAFPMSLGQQRLWFVEKFSPENISYNVPWNIDLTGPLQLELFKQSINHLISNHEILRTKYVTTKSGAVQTVSPSYNVAIDVSNLQNKSSEVSASIVNDYIENDATTPFTLDGGSLFRLKLFVVSPIKHILVVTMHHSITDGVSAALFNNELLDTYSRLASGRTPVPDQIKIEFGDYALWQQSALAGKSYEEQVEYWTKKLSGDLPIVALPSDRPHPVIRTANGSFEEFKLSSDFLSELKALAATSNVSLSSVLLTAYKILIHKYTQESDLLIGIPVAGRNMPDIATVLGYFVNTVVVRTKIDEGKTVGEYIKEVSDDVLNSLEHQDVPFEKVVEKIKPERELRYTPIFQHFFDFHSFDTGEFDLDGLDVKVSRLRSVGAQFDLSLHVIEEDGALYVSFNYNSDIFEKSTVSRMMLHFENTLRLMVSEPETEIGKLSLLTDNEKDLVLNVLNATDKDYNSHELLHSKFEEHARQYPKDVALLFEEKIITYKELDERANKLAHYLVSKSVGPNVLVGVLLERSIEMVVSLYAILKAGGAYVPIDPSYPESRISYMLDDANVPVLITSTNVKDNITSTNSELLVIDEEWDDQISALSSTKPTLVVASTDTAYTIYTSGSTGNPKGVMNSHRGIINRLEWMQDAYKLTNADCVLQKTPFSFDVSVWEFFWPLMFGSSLCIARPEGHKDANYLLDTIERYNVTTIHFVPSMLQLFIEAGSLEKGYKSLRKVICSGEALPIDLQDRFFEKMPDVELHNLYGPTEAAVDVSYWQCLPSYERRIVPIGKPISNIQLYVLDHNMNPVPIGVTGELYIGGVGVAKGYLNKEALTSEKFIDNPYSMSREDRQKLYKTGDLVRLLDDGNIEYLRREDNQIKIRGFRVELGEIESVINEHQDIRECVVVTADNPNGSFGIVAYLVPFVQDDKLVDALRAYLRNKLPEHMIPSAYMFIESMPLSPNGKVSRGDLPEVQWVRSVGQEIIAPVSKLENDILAIWQTHLKISDIGREDNFFDVGGHSLMLVRIQRDLQSVLDINISVIDLFQYSTIKSLANFISSTSVEESKSDKKRFMKQKAMLRKRRSAHNGSKD